MGIGKAFALIDNFIPTNQSLEDTVLTIISQINEEHKNVQTSNEGENSNPSESEQKSKRKIEKKNISNDKSLLSTKDGDRYLPKARGNRITQAALVNPDLDEGNITTLGRTRAQVKKKAMAQQYHLAFSNASLKIKNDLKWTREILPPAPKGWNQMIRHQFVIKFKRAVEKKYQTLEAKENRVHVEETEVPNEAKISL